MFGRLADFFEYGPLSAEAVATIRVREQKRRAARERARARYRARVQAAEAELGAVDVLLFGRTGEEVVRAEDADLRAQRRRMRETFRDEHADELEAAYYRARARQRWWEDDEPARKQAYREVWRRYGAEYRDELAEGMYGDD